MLNSPDRLLEGSVKQVVILGPIEPVIRRALRSAWAERVTLRESTARGKDLAREARLCGARAVIVPPEDLPELANVLPSDVIALGLSIGNFDLLVLKGRKSTRLPNPSPEAILALINS